VPIVFRASMNEEFVYVRPHFNMLNGYRYQNIQ
jgi:hypothetical protein